MKKFTLLSALILTATLCGAENLLTRTLWYPLGGSKQSIVDYVGKEIRCRNDGTSSREGVRYVYKPKTPVSGKLIFSAESKLSGVPAGATLKKHGHYSIYLDLSYADGTKKFGICAPFTYANHDWEKVSGEFVAAKPVVQVNYYLLFRNVAGDARFRNATLSVEQP